MATTEIVRNVGQTISTVFWTSVYFVYFLFKGKQEWKCEKLPQSTVQTYCCVDGKKCTNEHEHLRHRNNVAPPPPPPKPIQSEIQNAKPKTFYLTHSGVRGFLRSAWEKVRRVVGKGCEVLRNSKSKIVKWLKAGVYYIWQGIRCLFALISAFIFSNNVPSQTLPSTPKPYTTKPSSPSYNKVAFEFDESELHAATKQEIEDQDEPTIYEDVPRINEPPRQLDVPKSPASSSFYSERVFEEKPKPAPVREKSVPPPAPPPPPPKPVSREPSRARSTTPGRAVTPGRERKEVKGGIGGFGADIMDELEEQQRRRTERASVQREMTQSCHPDMAQWKTEIETQRHDGRASSVGPTMKKLEQVVSRVEGAEEPSFVFRPKMTYSSEEYQNKNRYHQEQQSPYLLGKSVFSPVDEVEKMRHDINSVKHQQQSYSSPQYQSGNWMESQRSRNVNRNDQVYDYQTVKNPFGSTAYKSSPYASHTARRSKTPNPQYGDHSEHVGGGVESIARQWPPVSNHNNNIGGRDEWINSSMKHGGFAGNNGTVDDNGLVTTMCRRVVERKREDNWKWKDENGRLLDEKNQNTWKGELDTLLRDGPNEGRHWSRTVEKMPTGDTRFQDVNRQYNKEYVVESVVRNY